ncbi:MAG: hypothetical protein J6Q84_04495 [Kiritimatiellae bacterium]|nr:hypothetical protein [Kiritimatiellia bacterium]
MGVSVSFSGGGKHRSFDLTGVPTGEAATFLGNRKKKAIIPDNIRRAMHPQPIDPTVAEKEGKVKLNAFDMRPDTLDKKTMPGSAITTSMTGLCLEGEQNNPVVVGTKFYGSHNGGKGYFALPDVDPCDSAARVGSLGAGKEGADTSEAKEGSPFAYQVASRVVMETDDIGRKVLVEYDKDVEATALGRTSKVTGERKRIVGVISENKKDKPHPYEVRYDKGWMIWLPSKELLRYDSKFIDVAEDLSAKGGIHDKWWYSLAEILPDIGGRLYLNLEKGDSQSEGDSETLKASFSQAAEGEISLVIADVSHDPVTGKINIRATVASAICLGGGGGGTSKRRPNPFEVHFFEADASTDWDRGYAVWMEDLDHLACINGQYATIENVKYANVYDANTGYGNWYFLDDETLTFGQTLYLVLTPERGESEGPKARLQTTPGTDADSVSVAIATIDAIDVGGYLEPRDIWQHVTSAVIVSTGGGGGTTNVASETIVALGMDYVTDPSDEDYEDYPYAIRLKRGYLKNVNGELMVKEDRDLTQFIDTTPYTGEQPYVGDL